jgi:phage/plasmid-associated DNA primase
LEPWGSPNTFFRYSTNNLCAGYNKYSKTNQNKNEKVIQLLNNIQQLRKIKFRKMLIEDIINKITDNKIIFDSHSNLFCFRNKLFNLNKNKFIDPRADYYIKTIADYDYNDKYNKINIEELENLIKKILPDTQTRKYYMEILSTGLYGERIENCFICIGKGGNGKSLLNGLMLKTVSKYGYKAPSSLVISPIKEGGNPAVYNMNKKRFILVSEPDEDAKFNSGTMKELTGDGIINSRTLYKSDDSDMIVEIKMTFVIESNDIPKLNKIDDGILRRFRNIPFVSRFVSDEKYDTLDEKTNVYRANQEYKTDKWQDEHKQALFEILRNHFIDFKNNNYKICNQSQEAKISTNEYLLGCDDVYDWFISKYQLYKYKDEKEEIKYIKIKDILYEDFIRSDFYLSLNYTQKRKLNLKDFIKRFENTLGEYMVDDYYIKENGINKRIYVKSIKNFVLIE